MPVIVKGFMCEVLKSFDRELLTELQRSKQVNNMSYVVNGTQFRISGKREQLLRTLAARNGRYVGPIRDRKDYLKACVSRPCPAPG